MTLLHGLQDKSSNSPTQQPLLQKEGSVPMLFLGGKNEGHPPQDILLESFMRKQHDFLLTDRDHHSASHVAENGTCQRNGYFHFMDQQVAPCGAVPSSNVQPVVQNPSLMRIQSSAGPLASDSTAVQMPRDGLGTGFLSIKSFSAVALPGLGSNAPHRSCPDDSPLQHRLTAAIGESEQGQKDHVVVLNVGGTRFWTTFFTVNSVEVCHPVGFCLLLHRACCHQFIRLLSGTINVSKVATLVEFPSALQTDFMRSQVIATIVLRRRVGQE